jgi:nucleoside-diphosphate-sugar epimerase
MRIFVTGATGYVGLAVAEALRRRGHAVAGLARSADKARALAAREIEPVLGDMRDAASYARAARDADALVHCAAEHSAEYEALDRATVGSLLQFFAEGARRRALIYTSGVWLYGSSPKTVDESAASERAELVPWRAEHEKRVLAAGGLVIRPGCVYGGSGGLTGLWFSGALERGAAPMAGDGANRWATVHVDDCAQLYALALESGLRGELFNATDASRSTVREMAEAASRAAGKDGKVVALGDAEADRAYGAGLAKGLRSDQRIDSSKARRALKWEPCFAGFAADAPRYFAAWAAARGA